MLGLYLQRGFSFFTLSVFFLFLCMGNLFRLLDNSLFSNHQLLSEMVLYGCSCLCLMIVSLPKKFVLQMGLLIGGIILSFLYGCILHGFSLSAGFYAGRLILLFVCILVLTELCWNRCQGELQPFFIFLCKAYLGALVLGSICYFLFPASEALWFFLRELHIGFEGDPHKGRFVSVYFDPNYYACIVGIPVLLTSYLYDVTRKRRYFFYRFLFLLSGFLTWSRSGIVVLVALMSYRGISYLMRGCFTKQGVLWGGGTFLFFVILSILCREHFFLFLQRIVHLFEDDSALCRLETFQFGVALWEQFPLFGLGINFLYPYTKEWFGLNSLDSSLLSLLVQIGTIPFFFLMLYGVVKSISMIPLHLHWKSSQKKSPYFFSWFCFYGGVSVIFASQFNNLLFYPFWILPFGVIFLYVCKSIQKNKDNHLGDCPVQVY